MIRSTLISILVFFVGTLSMSSCGKPADQKAYEEVVGTMSMEKAKAFFDNYSHSAYRDKLVNDIIEWCKEEKTEGCYRLAIEVLPKDHPRYKEIVSYYEQHFGGKK